MSSIITAPQPLPWSVERKHENVHIIDIPYEDNSAWEQYVLLSSDRHHDNPKCDWSMERRHLDLAMERGAIIVDVGDLFDVMQSKGDRRHTKGQLRKEYKKDNYLDAVVDEATEFYGPYGHLFAVLGRGNHDELIRTKLETDLLKRLANNIGTTTGGYNGFVRFQFRRASGTGGRYSKTMFYVHGAGGGGPVTRGVIKTNRRATVLSSADIIASGHIHEAWCLENVQYDLSRQGKVRLRTQYHVQCPTYKDEFKNGIGWAPANELSPKPLGAWWMRFYRIGDDGIGVEFTRAQ